LVLTEDLPLALVVQRLSDGAALFDLPTPSIACGEPANLTLVDLQREWVVGDGGYESRSANCCFDGQTLRGKVLLTVAAGTVAYRARQFEVVR
jgi:dihydroorotase